MKRLRSGVGLPPSGGLLAWALSACALSAVAGAAQERNVLVIDCGDGSAPEVTARCNEAVLALEAMRAGVGLSLSQGTDIPGFASTVGIGEGGFPKISTSLRFSITRLKIPVLIGSQQVPAESGTLTISSLQGNVGVGVFNGFAGPRRLRGIFSLDLLASAGLSILPNEDGFRGSELALGYGARLGVLREGFSNPGVALSLMRREFVHDVFYGTFVDDVQLGFDPGTTSLRLTVGRDYFTAGFILGGGFDWYDGQVSLTVRDREGGIGTGTATSKNFTSRRATAFAGGQYTYKIFQTSLELGWAEGFDTLEGYSGPFEAGSSTYYGSLAVRMTF